MRERNTSLLRKWLLRAFRCTVIRTESYESVAKQPAIVICNHVSFLDGVLIALASPRYMHFAVTADHAEKHPISSRILKLLERSGLGGVVALDMDHPFSLRQLLRHLRAGNSVMIFPTGQIQTPGVRAREQRGVKWLEQHSKAPVIRLRIRGAERSRFFGRCGQAWWPRIFIRY